ncbi:HAD family hydrolase [Paraburkholderia lycopersici]|uniref:Haloacid dehalogenase superfamily, subfamily IA, variant 1 with third motif having Dx(3-4)D or Dx(3-4)E n=1 Tax=Paraburkholderia lycopersici TaxID=416944 RepID=A0A1G6NFG0_9BURK|nr:HAD family hydrolase [Paraburkholderia lycopersici]SDC66609.1 hypothetical protein SAMN05421548_10936 [Paraburkholderia lycopersici]
MSVRTFDSFVTASAYIESALTDGKIKLLSFDVFDTVIFRRCSPDAVLHAVAAFLDRELRARNIAVRHGGSLGAYHAAYATLAHRNAAAGFDDEASTSALYGEWVREAAGHEDAALAERVREHMRERETSVCEANAYLRPLLEKARGYGVRMIYVSDMYIGNECVSAILEQAGIAQYFDHGYVSSDHALLKRTGRLFGAVLEAEGVAAGDVLHCGDNVRSDGERAAEAGLNAVVIRDAGCIERYESLHYRFLRWLAQPESAAAGSLCASFAQALPGTWTTGPEAYGVRVLGPIYASFMHRVVESCLERNVEHVYFLAREGYFLKQIFDEIARRRYGGRPLPQTTYLGVSRLTALFLGSRHFGLREISLALSNGPRNLLNLFSALQIERKRLGEIGARHGIADVEAILPDYFMSWGPFLALLDDPEISEIASGRHMGSQELLNDYLAQEGFFDHQRVAIVDVGWAGQIQDSLFRGVRYRADCPQMFGFYLGMNLSGHHRKTPGNWMDWVICDQAHLEWNGIAALQFPQSFEAITRSPHGTVVGYQRASETIEPVLKSDDVPSRQAEMLDDGLIALFQSSVREYVRHYTTAISMLSLHAAQTLPYGKQMTGRMIRFPTATEAGYLLRLNNVSDLGAAEMYRMGNLERLSVLRTKRLAQSLRSSFWKYGTLALTGRAAVLLQMIWNVRTDARHVPVIPASLDHGIVFHLPHDRAIVVEDEREPAAQGTLARVRASFGAGIAEVSAQLVERERRGYRFVDAYGATQPLTLREATRLYVAWRLAVLYCRLTKRRIPAVSAEPIGAFLRQHFLAQPHARRVAARLRHALHRVRRR